MQSFLQLIGKLKNYKNKHIVIDSAMDPGIGIRLACFKKYDPLKIQQQLRSQLKTPYYNSIVNVDEVYLIDNIEVNPLE